MRKNMTKEVTKTTLKVAKIEVVDGQPQTVELPDEVILGNVSMEKAQKLMVKEHGQGATVFSKETDTKTYVMPVDEFIKHASIKEEE